eukprot:5194792-Pleurochrysis_carterae.AAC.3
MFTTHATIGAKLSVASAPAPSNATVKRPKRTTMSIRRASRLTTPAPATLRRDARLKSRPGQP